MPITISIALKKGGSCKTTTAINLASHLVHLNKKVLVIDVDSQCNVSTGLGIAPILSPNYTQNNSALPSIIDVIMRGMSIEEAIIPTDFGIDLLPARTDLSQAELGMKPTQLHLLHSRISKIQASYNYILIDTPPNDQYMTTMALIASNSVLVPFQAQKFALEGIKEFLRIISEIQQFQNPSLKILGLLPTMLIKNTVISEIVMEDAKNKYPDLILPFEIYTSVQIQNAQLVGKPLLYYDKHHPANKIYKALASFIIKKYEG